MDALIRSSRSVISLIRLSTLCSAILLQNRDEMVTSAGGTSRVLGFTKGNVDNLSIRKSKDGRLAVGDEGMEKIFLTIFWV